MVARSAWGANLAQLRAEFGEAAQETFRHVAQEDAAVAKDLEDGITDWTFGELPELMEISRTGADPDRSSCAYGSRNRLCNRGLR